MLVDRQPIQTSGNHLRLDLGHTISLASGYRIAIIDPPWYPDHFKIWTYWTAQSVGEGGIIYASIWPDSTRPSAQSEVSAIFKEFSSWADCTFTPIFVNYETPHFEEIANQKGGFSPLSASPKIGNIVRFDVKRIPTPPKIQTQSEEWQRFLFNDYQIAIRVQASRSENPDLVQIISDSDWRWPYVSRRAPNRGKIDVWSSHNEVAATRNSNKLCSLLQRIVESQSEDEFNRLIDVAPSLSSWEIPRPPYWRTYKWTHHQ